MSGEALGWVYRHSPYTGVAFSIHVALADSANDQHGYELWARQEWIAGKARTTRSSVNRALSQMVDDGLLEVLEDNTGGPNRYRLLMPDGEDVWRPAWVSRQDTPTEEVSRADTASRDEGSHRGVSSGHTPNNPSENPTVEPNQTSPAAADDPDDSPFPDVATEETIEQARRLCRTLAAYVKRNGHALPASSSARDGWLVEMERLVRIGPPGDVDWPDDPGDAAAEVERVMLWALDVSDFWPANIRSAPTLRAKFTQLRAQANRSNGRRGRTPTGDEYRAIAAELRRMGR